MSDDPLEDLALARQRWLQRQTDLPVAVQAMFTAWTKCRETEQDDALSQITGVFKPPGCLTTKQKCRDLTLLQSSLPSSAPFVAPLTRKDVAVFFRTVAQTP
jgi:hypothetical protein